MQGKARLTGKLICHNIFPGHFSLKCLYKTAENTTGNASSRVRSSCSDPVNHTWTNRSEIDSWVLRKAQKWVFTWTVTKKINKSQTIPQDLSMDITNDQWKCWRLSAVHVILLSLACRVALKTVRMWDQDTWQRQQNWQQCDWMNWDISGLRSSRKHTDNDLTSLCHTSPILALSAVQNSLNKFHQPKEVSHYGIQILPETRTNLANDEVEIVLRLKNFMQLARNHYKC